MPATNAPALPFNANRCPACNRVKGNASTIDAQGVATCTRCSAIFSTRRLYLGDSYGYVRPFMTSTAVPADQLRYFDFDVLGSQGPDRRHGWFDPATRLVVQAG